MKSRIVIYPFALILAPILLLLQMTFIVFLPFPFSEINIFAAAVVISLLITESGSIVWWAFALFTLLDWYTVGPFGVVLSAGVLATLFLVWLYRDLLTNRGLLSAAILAAAYVAMFRVLYTVFLAVVRGFGVAGVMPLLNSAMVELLITTAFVGVVYFIVARIVPALKVTHTKRNTLYAGN